MIEKEAVIVAWLPTAETNTDKALKMWRSNPELTKCSTIGTFWNSRPYTSQGRSKEKTIRAKPLKKKKLINPTIQI